MSSTRLVPVEVSRNELVNVIDEAEVADFDNGNGFANSVGCRLLFIPQNTDVAGTITIHSQGGAVSPAGGRYGEVDNPDIEITILYDDHIQVYECALPAGRFNQSNGDAQITYADFGETDVLNVVVLKEVD